jgi:hypothetical protein
MTSWSDNLVYFTAGPNEETAGLFGYLTAVPKELTQGSDQ